MQQQGPFFTTVFWALLFTKSWGCCETCFRTALFFFSTYLPQIYLNSFYPDTHKGGRKVFTAVILQWFRGRPLLVGWHSVCATYPGTESEAVNMRWKNLRSWMSWCQRPMLDAGTPEWVSLIDLQESVPGTCGDNGSQLACHWPKPRPSSCYAVSVIVPCPFLTAFSFYAPRHVHPWARLKFLFFSFTNSSSFESN